MKILVLGATGATGRLLAQQLLDRGEEIKVVVRSDARLSKSVLNNSRAEIIIGNVLEMSHEATRNLVKDCKAVACCLGHNITMKGVFGRPRKLVTESVRLVGEAIRANQTDRPVKFVLMNTVGNLNRDLPEKYSLGDQMVIGLIRVFVPPQSDNEQAAEYFRTEVGQGSPHLEWVAVRPDTLIDTNEITEFEAFPSPVSSPIFGKRQTSRINVARFIATLLTDSQLWNTWRGQMPVLYNTQGE